MSDTTITWEYLERRYGLKPMRGGSPDGDGDASNGSDNDGAGDGTSGGNGEDVTGLKNALTAERGANRAIKEFARERNIKPADVLKLITDAENKDKSDLQRAQDAIKEWERKHGEAQQRARDKAGRAAALEAARAANAVSAKAVYAIVRDGLEYDDDDEPTNLDALIAKAKKDEPELFRAAAGSGDGGKGSDTPKDGNAAVNTWLRQAAGRAG